MLAPVRTILADNVRLRLRVIFAIMLRDMASRYGRTYWGYVIAVGWPLTHLLIIVMGFMTVNRFLFPGSESLIFISTGALPYILCMYPARLTAMVLMQNRPILSLPIIQPIDLFVARIALEIFNACLVTIVFCLGLWLLDVDFMPVDLPTALIAVYASIFFGVALGFCAVLLVAIGNMVGYMFFIAITIVLYISSGVTIPTGFVSDRAREFIGYNPVFQLAEWMRSAYFESHSTVALDKSYVLLLSAGLLFLGLLGERALRGRILS